MSRTKQPSKKKRRNKTVPSLPALGAAGLSLSLAGSASAATGGSADILIEPNAALNHEITLGEEELSDVSLGTFYVFDKENAAGLQSGIKVARGCRGCGCGGRVGLRQRLRRLWRQRLRRLVVGRLRLWLRLLWLWLWLLFVVGRLPLLLEALQRIATRHHRISPGLQCYSCPFTAPLTPNAA